MSLFSVSPFFGPALPVILVTMGHVESKGLAEDFPLGRDEVKQDLLVPSNYVLDSDSEDPQWDLQIRMTES